MRVSYTKYKFYTDWTKPANERSGTDEHTIDYKLAIAILTT